MIVVCVDDHQVMLNRLLLCVQEILPNDSIYGFTECSAALAFVKEHGCDVLLGEIELYSQNGNLLAEEIKSINPKVNIIFVTVCDEKEHAREVLKLKPSGYLTKPSTKEQIREELQQLRYPIERMNAEVF